MTVSITMVSDVSPYTVSDTAGSIFTTTLFNSYKADAAAILDTIAPAGLPSVIYDRCHALLITHFYALKLGQIEMRSQESGDVVWVQPGKTGYWIQCMDLLKQFKSKPYASINVTAEGVTRADAATTAFRLDQSTPLNYFDEPEG